MAFNSYMGHLYSYFPVVVLIKSLDVTDATVYEHLKKVQTRVNEINAPKGKSV